jgi:processive 1,2-diacylglycerol beta-glucosyltransferase
MRKLLIITSMYTGHGHKSIAEALAERLSAYDDIEIKIIDGFSLMNRFEQYMAEYTYGPITRMPGKAWEWNFLAGLTFRKPVVSVVASMIRAKLLALLDSFRPDAILSAHPIFLATVLDVMDDAGLRIPLIAHEVDLIDITEYWYDPRIYRILAPSRESYECTLARVDDPGRVIEVGFPVRARFMNVPAPAPHQGTVVTVMSGSEGSGIIRAVTRVLLKHTDVHVNVVCGRNRKLRKKLKKAFAEQYHGRLSVMGFIDDIQNVMAASDILILRASPNAAMEAVVLNVPVILFGQLAGQEQHNPDVLQDHGVAVYCPEPEALPGCINDLFACGGAKMEAMRAAQRAYTPADSAAGTARLLHELVVPRQK